MTLFIDACARDGSRTRELAEYLLSLIDGPLETAELYKENIPPLDENLLKMRDKASEKGDFSDPYFRFAKQFASADKIVIAAPFWDMSFPAVLKRYMEAVCITGITFRYSETGVPIGMCKAKELYYVTTAGGRIYDRSFGYGYIEALAKQFFGIPETHFYSAEDLDIYGNCPEKILEESKREILENQKLTAI